MRKYVFVIGILCSSFAGGVFAQTIGGSIVTTVLAGLFYGGVLSLNSTAAQSSLGLYLNETFTGSCTSGCSGNLITVGADNTTSNGGNVNGVKINHTFGGALATGNRVAFVSQGALTSTTGNTSTNQSYGGAAIYFNAAANDNGTDLLANAQGQVESLNVIATMTGAATFWRNMQTAEFDSNANIGASVKNKMGIAIAQLSTDKVAGSNADMALLIGNQNGAVGWNSGLVFGGGDGIWPFANAATAITCLNCGTLANVIDMSAATITGAPIIMPLLTPSSQTDTCKTGSIKWDATQIYICTSTNHWKRAALSDSPF